MFNAQKCLYDDHVYEDRQAGRFPLSKVADNRLVPLSGGPDVRLLKRLC